MFGLMGVARLAGQPGGVRYTYYVDSVNGSDANAGTSPAQALQTIAAVPTLTAGQSIGLARGSTWREELVISADNCLAGAYGTGDKPMLDCSDVVAAGSWTKTGGYTNIYQATVAVGFDALAAEWPGLWVDDVRMIVVASLALCDSTPGSIYHGSVTDTSPITLYVHPPGSTDATSDGKVYEASVRRSGVYSYAAANVIIRGLQGRRNYTSYGSFCVGRGGLLDDCLALEGNTHNIFLRGNAEARDCIARDCYNHSESPTMYIGFDNPVESGATITYTRCTAENTTYYAACIGFYCHGAGTFASVTHTGCTVNNVGNPFSVADATVCYVTGATVTNFSLILGSTNVPIIASGIVGTLAKVGAHWGNFGGAAASVTLDGCTVTFDTTGHLRALTSGQTMTMRNCTITGANTILLNTAAGTTYISEDNNFVPAGRMSIIYSFGATTPTITSDRNNYNGSTGDFIIGGVTHADLAAWQVATGQDANSTP